MDKNKRNVLILVGLVVLAGGLAVYMFFIRDTGSPPPKKTPSTTDGAAAGGTQPAQPAGAAAQPAGGAAAKPADTEAELPSLEMRAMVWRELRRPDDRWDPLKVQDIRAVRPELAVELAELTENWKPDGVVKTGELDDNGDEIYYVFFKDNRRPFLKGDRLTGDFRNWKIVEIIWSDEKAGVSLKSDSGTDVTFEVAGGGRYEED